ncbi:MAG: ATP-binding protein [Pseudomonadota bacterium]
MNITEWDTAPVLKQVLGVAPGVIYVFNQETQSNDYANRSLVEVLGYTMEDVHAMGKSVMETIAHPDDLPEIDRHFAAIRELSDNAVLTITYRMKHKDGHWVWLMSRDTVFERASDGSVISHIGNATDITTQMELDAEVKAVRDELETVFNAASSGIIALNANGKIVRINSRARHMLGGISDEPPFDWPKAIKFLDAETMRPLDASADPVRRALSGHSLRGETHLMRRLHDGDGRRYVRVDNTDIEDKRSGIQTVLVIDDVSNEERNRQAIERKSRLDALGQLTGGIAHDFNNLLAAVLYAMELASRTEDGEKRGEYLETARASIEQGRALSNRLLSFARQQPGLASVKATDEVFADFLKLVRPMLEAQINMSFTVDDPGLRHYCDQTQLETALMNLVLNSRDAILRSGMGNRIELTARRTRAVTQELEDRQPEGAQDGADPSSYRYVEISVTDNGPGMDEETVARCTDPFFTTKDANSGTGLGLAIVYGFVRQSDGDLRIYSEQNVGTTVQIILPLGTEQGAREEAMPDEEILRGNGETILVVEDEMQLLIMMTDMLEDLGYEVITARSGREALDIVESGDEFDLLLTDVVMPGSVGGFELARRVLAARPDMPVLYSSGYTGFTATEMGEVQAPLLQKPAPPAELSQLVKKTLSGAA